MPPDKMGSIRGFERGLRIQELLGARLIQSPAEVPADAIPATVEVVGTERPPSPEVKRLIKELAACVRARVPDPWEWESCMADIEKA
jgi:hypothetical protein